MKMSVEPDDKEMARILANPGEITEEEKNMTNAEFSARKRFFREQSIALAREAAELEMRLGLASNDNGPAK
jgi:hypothetical protein